jgi:hypothetical protein
MEEFKCLLRDSNQEPRYKFLRPRNQRINNKLQICNRETSTSTGAKGKKSSVQSKIGNTEKTIKNIWRNWGI